MFARVFDTAKRILSRSPSVPGGSSDIRETPPNNADASMVMTRGGVETPGAATPVAATPRSSGKKRVGKRELEALDTPTQAKRQRKASSTPKKKVIEETPEPDAPVDEPAQESAGDTSDTITVTIPSSKEGKQSSAKKIPIRRRSSPQVMVGKLSPPAFAAAESFEDAIQDDLLGTISTPELRSGSKKADGSPTPKAKTAKVSTPSSTKKTRGRPRKVQHEDPHTVEITQTTTTKIVDEIPSSSFESSHAPIPSQETPTSAQPKKAHKRFGSEEPIERVVAHTQGSKRNSAPQPTEQNDDSASDSDEAPEVVTTATATSKAQAAKADADRAQRAQQQKEQAKRQAREELVAAQQAAKREREEKKAKKLARQAAKQAKDTPASEDDVSSRSALDIPHSLPALLPTSLLETITDQRPPTPPPTRHGKTEEELRQEKLSHHIKFLERTEKPVKDVKKGKLSVAVLGRGNDVLPPKASRESRNVREHWLKGRELQKKGKAGKPNFGKGRMERRGVVGGVKGFLKGED